VTAPSGAPSDAPFTGALYAANTAHHRAHDGALLADVPLGPGVRVLDLGCGTGDLTARVAERVRGGGGGVLGIDASASQVGHARAAHAAAGLEFAVGRAQDLARLVPARSFDVVLSVATLHWVPRSDQPAVFTALARALRAGGVLRIDMGGQGQIEAARSVLDEVSARHGGPASPWYFPGPQEYRELLEEAGFAVRRVRLLHQRRPFPDPAAFEGWLRSQVLPAYLPGVAPGRRTRFAADAVRQGVARLRRGDGSLDQDYVRLDVVALAP
jgi:trans-aconitate methyltransferase